MPSQNLRAATVALMLIAASTCAIADQIQAVSSPDGRLEVFVQSGSDKRIFHLWQTQMESGSAAVHWHWERADTQLKGDDFVSGRDSAGRLFVAAIDNGVIHFNAPAGANASFGNAWSLDTHDVHGIELATNADGRIELFSLSNKGVAWSTAETQAGSRTFANHYIGGTQLRAVAPTPSHDGRLALIALGGDRSVWWASQTAPNANWNAWSSLAGHDIQAVAAAPNADGRLDIVALGADKALYHRYELTSGGFSAWETLAPGPFAEPVSMVRNADGHLEVFLHNTQGQIVHSWQLAPNGSWSNFVVMDTIAGVTTADSVAMMPDGRLVIAALADGNDYPAIRIASQVAPNSAWVAWALPPVSDPTPPPKPHIDKFISDNNNCYGPIGIACTFTWSVSHCGSDCQVSMVGMTGLGQYNVKFFEASSLPATSPPQGLSVTPKDTNTMFTLTATSPAGSSDPAHVEGKLTGSGPAPCTSCMNFYFKLTPPSNNLPCTKKMYVAPNAGVAEQWANAEFPGWSVMTISAATFLAYGC